MTVEPLQGEVSVLERLLSSLVGLSTLTITVVPLIIGLGVDDGLHVVHRIREDPGAPPDQAAVAVGQAITLTTCASFSVPMFADHSGMEGMAKVMLIGLPVCLLASVSLVPALAVLTRASPVSSGAFED